MDSKIITVNGIDFNVEILFSALNIRDMNGMRVAFIEADEGVEQAFYTIWDLEDGARDSESAPRDVYDKLIADEYDDVARWLCEISF